MDAGREPRTVPAVGSISQICLPGRNETKSQPRAPPSEAARPARRHLGSLFPRRESGRRAIRRLASLDRMTVPAVWSVSPL